MNDRFFSYQWNIKRLTNDGESYRIHSGNRNVKIALIDSGIDYNHTDLRHNIDEKNSASFSGESDDIMDYNGHGSMVAGMICGNGSIQGIAPNISLLICKVSEDSTFKISNLLRSLTYAIECNVDIINISLSAFVCETDKKVIDYFHEIFSEARKRNITIVSSAGNRGIDLRNNSKKHVFRLTEDTIVVGASNVNGTITSYSNYGELDILAPGGEWTLENLDLSHIILTTYPTNLNDMDSIRNNLGLPKGYTLSFGTSLSCAQVSGTVGLITSYMFDLTGTKPTPKMIKKLLNQGKINETPHGDTNIKEVNAYQILSQMNKDNVLRGQTL